MTTETDGSGCKISRYKGHEYEVPDKTLVWQLTGKGFESFHLEEIDVPAMDRRISSFAPTLTVSASPM